VHIIALTRCGVWTTESWVAWTGQTWTGRLVQTPCGTARKTEESQQVTVVCVAMCIFTYVFNLFMLDASVALCIDVVCLAILSGLVT